MYTERLSEQLCVIATIDPQAGISASAVTSDAFSMQLHRRALFVLSTGIGASGGVAVTIEEGTASAAGFTGILTATAPAVVADNSQYLFEVSSSAMSDGYAWLRAVVTPVATPLLSLIALADVGRYHPDSDRDLASVVSIQAT